MAGWHLFSDRRRSLRRGVAATAATVAVCALITPIALESATVVALSTNLAAYVLGVGGTNDGASVNIGNKLSGEYSNYHPVVYPGAIWPVSGITSPTFATSVSQGNSKLNSAIGSAPPGQNIVVVGYSLGAVVANKSRQQLESDPAAPNIEFVLLADANKPNGGIFGRFPTLNVPFADIQSDGALGPDQFTTTDITREYDTYGDFPAYFNLLSLANSLAAVQYVHPDPQYDDIDMHNLPVGTDIQTVGSTTYYLVPTAHLPLLQPLRDAATAANVPVGFLIDAVEPALRVLIDMGYDRETSPATAKPFSLFTPTQNYVKAAQEMPAAIQEGIDILEAGPVGAVPGQVQQNPNTPSVQLNSKSAATNPGSAAAAVKPAPARSAVVLPLTSPVATPPVPVTPPVPASPPAIADVGTASAAEAVAANGATLDHSSAPAPETTSHSKTRPDPGSLRTPPKRPAPQKLSDTPKASPIPSLKDRVRSSPGAEGAKAKAPGDHVGKPADGVHHTHKTGDAA